MYDPEASSFCFPNLHSPFLGWLRLQDRSTVILATVRATVGING